MDAPRLLDDPPRPGGGRGPRRLHRWAFWSVVRHPGQPALAVVALFSFMTAWNEFTSSPRPSWATPAATPPGRAQRLRPSEYGADWGAFAAGAIVVSLPVMILFFMLQRYFVEGLTAGSVKG
ncbi:MAG: hypothetical protein R3F62_01955 [Planctomycetota bacterium]